MRFAHVASRAFGRPLLLHPARGQTFLAALASELRGREFDASLRPPARAYDDEGAARGPVYASLPVGLVERDYRKMFPQLGNVAVLQVDGVLVNSLGSVDPWCGMTGYDGLRTQLNAAMVDTSVAAIALVIESPGGEVTGCFDLAAQIREARAIKPVWAIADGVVCSAAYALACSAGRITCSSTGYAGSIGVICAHSDFSAAAEQAGVKVTLIYAGAHKADGNPYEPLPDAVRADFQAEIDAVYDQFVACVSAGRGLDDAAIRGTEARSYLAADAEKIGLIDQVQSPTDALEELVELVS